MVLNLNPQRGSQLRRRNRINLTSVVIAIRQHNHDAAFAVFDVLETLAPAAVASPIAVPRSRMSPTLQR